MHTRHSALLLLAFLACASADAVQYTSAHGHQSRSRQNLRQFETLPDASGNAKISTTPTQQKAAAATASADDNNDGDQKHSRTKRMIWITDDGRLALPPGTVLSISPTISLPLVRHPPAGFLSNMTMSFPLTIDFDQLGLTDNENPLGVLPPVFGRSMGRAAGSMISHYVSQYLNIRRKRDVPTAATTEHNNDREPYEELVELPASHQHVFHGGERAILYGVVEDVIATFGFNGKACMLRAICEMHSKSVHHYGLFGEMAKLFFTASKSRYSDMLPEYVTAEKVGEGSSGPGECFPYYKDCPRSLFRSTAPHRYSDITTTTDEGHEDDDDHKRSDLDADHVAHLDDNEIQNINDMDERYNM